MTITDAYGIADVASTGRVVVRVIVRVDGGTTMAGRQLAREYLCDPTSLGDRRDVAALVAAGVVPVDANGNFAPRALIGARVLMTPTTDGTSWSSMRSDDADPDAALSSMLTCTKEGHAAPTGANIEAILRFSPELRGRIRYDVLAQQIRITAGIFAGVVTDLDVAVANWLTRTWGLRATSRSVGEQLLYVARRYGTYDPLREYLDGLTWDGVPRIADWLTVYCGVAPNDYVRLVGWKWLVSGAARGLAPGSKVDTVLVLRGPQGAKKSTALGVLGGEWFSDTPLLITDKDSRISAASTWVVELAELSALRRADIEAVKAFLSARRDHVRPPYGRVAEVYQRRCLFGATTNESTFLVDTTGNRRFWIVDVGTIDIDALRRDRDQLWAEAVVRCRAGEPWWFADGEQHLADRVAEQHEVDDPWVDEIRAYLASNPRPNYRLIDVAREALGIDPSEIHRHKNGLAKALVKNGLVARQVGSTRERRWVRP